MNKLFKTTLFIGLGLIIVSFIIGLKFNDIKNYFNDDANYESKSLIIDESVTNINISLIDRNINVIRTSGESYIQYYVHKEKEILNIINEDQEFDFEIDTKKTLTNFLSTKYTSNKVREVNLYINENVLDLTIKNVFGEIIFGDISLTNLNIKSTTGKIELNDLIILETLNIILTTGNINLSEIHALLINLENTTGNIKLNNLASNDITVKTTTGDINITDKREDIGYLATVTTGNIKLNGIKVDALNDQKDKFLIFYNLKTTTGNINIK